MMRPDLTTRVQPRDVILVHMEKQPAFYARVEEILLDRKPGWLQLRFQVLTLPPQELTWILEPNQIDGDEFTMGGTPITIERMEDPTATVSPEPEPVPAAKPRPTGPGTVITFPPRKTES